MRSAEDPPSGILDKKTWYGEKTAHEGYAFFTAFTVPEETVIQL